VNDFDQLHPAIRYHIVNTLGWSDLRPTQRDSIAPIHQGVNVLLLAPTAGGKTEAAVLPLLSRAASERWTGLSVLARHSSCRSKLGGRGRRLAAEARVRCGG
jgi:ATP-dependent Lhr-like helicase